MGLGKASYPPSNWRKQEYRMEDEVLTTALQRATEGKPRRRDIKAVATVLREAQLDVPDRAHLIDAAAQRYGAALTRIILLGSPPQLAFQAFVALLGAGSINQTGPRNLEFEPRPDAHPATLRVAEAALRIAMERLRQTTPPPGQATAPTA